MKGRVCFSIMVLFVAVASCSTRSIPMSQQPTVLPGGISMTCSQFSDRPVLGPQYLPEGLNRLTMLQCESDHFLTEYRGPGQRLLLGAGPLSPPVMDRAGEQTQVTVRGQAGTLQMADKSHPSQAVQLWWEEPAQAVPATGGAQGASIFNLLSAEGIAPEDLLRIAEGLKPLDVTSKASPCAWVCYRRVASLGA